MVITIRDVVLNILPGFKFTSNKSEAAVAFKDADKIAAWEIYIELVTRISLEPLLDDEGDEETALNSLYTLFQNMRASIGKHGPKAVESARIGIFVLNKVLRPFLARWHKIVSDKNFDDVKKAEFRKELSVLQKSLKGYADSLLKLIGIDGDMELL